MRTSTHPPDAVYNSTSNNSDKEWKANTSIMLVLWQADAPGVLPQAFLVRYQQWRPGIGGRFSWLHHDQARDTQICRLDS